MNEYLIWILVVSNIYLFLSLRKEKKRLRVLTSFIGGLIRFTSKTKSMIEEMVNKEALSKEEYLKKVNCYEILLEDIGKSFERDFWATPYEKFIKSDRNLFWEEKLSNGGFNQMFLDFHDKCVKKWYAIKHNNDKKWEENDLEVLGEKLIYKDFMDNKTENLKSISIPKNPRLFFKYLSEEEIKKIEEKLGVKYSKQEDFSSSEYINNYVNHMNELLTNKTKKCEKCGKPLKRSGPYAHNKPEGALTHKGLDEVSFSCTNETCENYNKNIKVFE